MENQSNSVTYSICLGNGNLVFIPGNNPHGFSEDQLRGLFFRSCPERLTSLWTIDAFGTELQGCLIAKHGAATAVKNPDAKSHIDKNINDDRIRVSLIAFIVALIAFMCYDSP